MISDSVLYSSTTSKDGLQVVIICHNEMDAWKVRKSQMFPGFGFSLIKAVMTPDGVKYGFTLFPPVQKVGGPHVRN